MDYDYDHQQIKQIPLLYTTYFVDAKILQFCQNSITCKLQNREHQCTLLRPPGGNNPVSPGGILKGYSPLVFLDQW